MSAACFVVKRIVFGMESRGSGLDERKLVR